MTPDVSQRDTHPRGAFAAEAITRLINDGCVRSTGVLAPRQIQPASLDLTLSDEAYKLPGSILPLRHESVRDVLGRFRARRIDLDRPQYFDRGQVYLVRLNEQLALTPDLGAYTNNKSSIGRIDLQTRTISDRNPRYEKHRRGYTGPLWVEVISKSFDVRVSAGVSLNQAIFYGRREILDDVALAELMSTTPLLYEKTGRPLDREETFIDQGLLMSIDLDQDVVGWVARKSPNALILDEPTVHDAREFFDPVPRPKDGRLFLMRSHFYILSTHEYIRVPPDYAVEMLPYETTAGEFRAHYAGFFDPGFGFGENGEISGTPAVLEVRPYDDDLILRHEQPICKMAYEKLTSRPKTAYGAGTASHYFDQRGPRLSKYFGPATG